MWEELVAELGEPAAASAESDRRSEAVEEAKRKEVAREKLWESIPVWNKDGSPNMAHPALVGHATATDGDSKENE